jgi:hypothetical protein
MYILYTFISSGFVILDGGALYTSVVHYAMLRFINVDLCCVVLKVSVFICVVFYKFHSQQSLAVPIISRLYL